jgi:sec-independent protein translocase protein TatB
MNVLGMGPGELLLVLAIALIIFGPDQLPQIARQLGHLVGEVRRLSAEATAEFQKSIQEEPPPRDSEPRPLAYRPPAQIDKPAAAPEDLKPPY